MLDGIEQLEVKLIERIDHLVKHKDEQDDAPFQSVAQELTAQVKYCRLRHHRRNLQLTFSKFANIQDVIEKNDFGSALKEVKSDVLVPTL